MSFPLQLDWKCGPDMPITMSGYIQSVEIEGTVYVGGGDADNEKNYYTVMVYNIQSSQWYTLCPYSAKGFAMTTINNKLVLVGGYDKDGKVVNQIGMWQPDSSQWTYPYPPMTTPRCAPSAATYKQWLVVAGGYHHDYLSSVEILDVDNKQWSAGPSIPVRWSYMWSTIIDDTWYLAGGEDDELTTDVYHIKFSSILSKSKQKVWNTISGHKWNSSCPLNIGGTLLVAGGHDDYSAPMSTILRYVSEINEWVASGELPCKLYNFTSITVSNKLYIFGGNSNEKHFLSSTYYCEF